MWESSSNKQFVKFKLAILNYFLVICWFDCTPEYLDNNISSEHDIFIAVDLSEM